MNLNEDDIEKDLSVDFKPITPGLGFNKKEDIDQIVSKKPKLKPEKWVDIKAIQQNLQESVHELPPRVPRPQPLGLAGGPTRNGGRATATLGKNESSLSETSEEVVNFLPRFFAWMIDVSLVFLTAIFSCLTIEYFYQKDFSLKVLEDFNNWQMIILPLFVFYFIFYFSILWKTLNKTAGMKVFNLTIVSTNKSEIHLKQTLFRSLFGLLSLVTFGIVDILGVTESLTWTTVKKA